MPPRKPSDIFKDIKIREIKIPQPRIKVPEFDNIQEALRKLRRIGK